MISAILPVYNQARYLAEAVRSVWRQERPDLELVIVDDGSTDGTPDAVKRLAREGPLRYVRQANAGPAAARNRGLREAAGEWVAFVDADCYWLPGKLRAQWEAIEGAGQPVDFCYTGSLLVDDQGAVMATRIPTPTAPLVERLLWGNCLSTSSVLARKARVLDVGGFDESLRIGEDWNLWLRLTARDRVQYVPAALMAERWNDWDKKYNMRMYERGTKTVLRSFFSWIRQDEACAHLRSREGLIRSWHLSVLSKSYFRHRHPSRALLLGLQSVLANPRGLAFLLRLLDQPYV